MERTLIVPRDDTGHSHVHVNRLENPLATDKNRKEPIVSSDVRVCEGPDRTVVTMMREK